MTPSRSVSFPVLKHQTGPSQVCSALRQRRGDLIDVCQCLQGGSQENEPGSAQWCQSTGASDRGHQSDTQQLPPGDEEKLPCAATTHRNRLSREAVESPSLEIFQNCLNTTLYRVLWGHRITERFWLEGDFEDHPVPTPSHGMEQFPLDQESLPTWLWTLPGMGQPLSLGNLWP